MTTRTRCDGPGCRENYEGETPAGWWTCRHPAHTDIHFCGNACFEAYVKEAYA